MSRGKQRTKGNANTQEHKEEKPTSSDSKPQTLKPSAPVGFIKYYGRTEKAEDSMI